MSSDQLKGVDGNMKVPVPLMDPPPGADPCVCMLPDPGGRRPPPRRAWSCIEKGLVVGLSLAILVIFVLLLIIFIQDPILPKGKVGWICILHSHNTCIALLKYLIAHYSLLSINTTQQL